VSVVNSSTSYFSEVGFSLEEKLGFLLLGRSTSELRCFFPQNPDLTGSKQLIHRPLSRQNVFSSFETVSGLEGERAYSELSNKAGCHSSGTERSP